MPNEPMSFLEADARFVSKEAFASLAEAIKLSEARIMAAITQLTNSMNARHDDDNRRYESIESRLRITEALAAETKQRVVTAESDIRDIKSNADKVPAPSQLSVMGQSIITQALGSILTIASLAALGYAYIHNIQAGH